MAKHIPIAMPRSGAVIDNSMDKVIRHFQNKALHDPIPFKIEEFFEFDLEKWGIKSGYEDLPSYIYGVTDPNKKQCLISKELMNDSSKSGIRFARYTMAHECYHAIIHVSEFENPRERQKFIHSTDHSKTGLKLYR